MDASQLKINPDHLRFKQMTKGERARLRRENIKALIKNTPAGTPITLPEFAAVTRGKEGTAWAMLSTMIKNGEITRTVSESHGKRFTYTVNDAKTLKSPNNGQSEHVSAPVVEPHEPVLSEELLLAAAKQFIWEKDSDSLREFVKWVQERNDKR